MNFMTRKNTLALLSKVFARLASLRQSPAGMILQSETQEELRLPTSGFIHHYACVRM